MVIAHLLCNFCVAEQQPWMGVQLAWVGVLQDELVSVEGEEVVEVAVAQTAAGHHVGDVGARGVHGQGGTARGVPWALEGVAAARHWTTQAAEGAAGESAGA